MLAETGVCSGIENYSRHLDGRAPGETPYTLLDFFPKDYLVVIDESHVAVPQLHGQYAGDRSRKDMLVEHGFRLPSARGQPPAALRRVHRAGAPGHLRLGHPGRLRDWSTSTQMVEQVIRPTGLVDPEVVIRPTKGQIDDLLARIDDHGRRRRAGPRHHPDQEDGRGPDRLPGRRRGAGAVPALRHRHHHPDRDPARAAPRLDRRAGRASTCCARASTCPRCPWWPSSTPTRRGSCARPPRSSRPWAGRPATSTGTVVLYADTITDAMREAVSVTQRRREMPDGLQPEHGIDPQTIRKAVTDILERLRGGTAGAGPRPSDQRRSQPGRGAAERRGTGAPAAFGDAGRAATPPRRPMAVELMTQLEAEMKAGRRRAALRGGGTPARRDRRAAAPPVPRGSTRAGAAS